MHLTSTPETADVLRSVAEKLHAELGEEADAPPFRISRRRQGKVRTSSGDDGTAGEAFAQTVSCGPTGQVLQEVLRPLPPSLLVDQLSTEQLLSLAKEIAREGQRMAEATLRDEALLVKASWSIPSSMRSSWESRPHGDSEPRSPRSARSTFVRRDTYDRSSFDRERRDTYESREERRSTFDHQPIFANSNNYELNSFCNDTDTASRKDSVCFDEDERQYARWLGADGGRARRSGAEQQARERHRRFEALRVY